MKYVFSLVLLMLITWEVDAQTYTFAVKRAADAEPVRYAHIQISNSLQGVVTNENGLGTLTIPSKYSNDEVKVSFMGYDVKVLQINKLKPDQINEVLLEEYDIELSGVSVVDIGISPSDFYLKTIDMVDKTFYTKSYTGLASYSEKVVEDGEATFNYEVEILYDSQGFRKATGRNEFINNDDAYLRKFIKIEGEQKYSHNSVGDLLNFNFPNGRLGYVHDTYLYSFLINKNGIEKQLLYKPETEKVLNWIFEELQEIDGEKFVKLVFKGKNGHINYWVNIETYQIKTIERKIIRNTSEFQHQVQGYAKGDLELRIDYFVVDDLSYVKQVEMDELKRIGISPELGTKRVSGKLVFHEHTNEKPDKKTKIEIDFLDTIVMKKENQ
ncbi:carboxypeptidase-like regulatory domain-containing protein [Belliella sp. R4-6]|uniref:Carboxypeptidase-like regulatory domain-containing protein n=1 Tax=Belliella alkalica TaxID=1730871 RepID=A0ABS9VF88_9BACT|nr:carboxypeptidase-like regulatory domain-containing protein [Belliella alkalica]MCH7415111.1 carboxypeptidase-like regulatory domain-containing protein [Belliella alkalica]